MPGRAWRSPLRNDHVTLDRIDLDAPVLEPPDPALEHAFVALELEHHPPVVGLHVGAADVDDDVEVLYQAVEDRLLDQVGREGQAHAQAGHGGTDAQAPPAMAGTIETWSFAFSAVVLPSRKRMSSSLT